MLERQSANLPRAAGRGPEKRAKDPFLAALGQRVRALRARRGLTRREVAEASDVSERHLANLEYGAGNVSILVLREVANALQCPLAELTGDVTTSSAEWLLLRELLEHRDDATLRRVRAAIGTLLDTGAGDDQRSARIALLGLRGAGKSTLGRMLAKELDVPFVELSRAIEQLAGCSVGEIQALYGASAYRRWERRALEQAIKLHPQAVLCIPGGLVSDAGSFNLLLARCTTVWLKAEPEDHMARVVAQGDLRPMASSDEAMEDLKAILKGRAPFYSKAEFSLDTSAAPLAATFAALADLVRGALRRAEPAGARNMQQTA